jgi:hypothetical protein
VTGGPCGDPNGASGHGKVRRLATRGFEAQIAAGKEREAAMAVDRKTGEETPMSEADRLRLQALADKRNEAMDRMADTVRKQQESQRGIVDKLR